MAGGAVTPEAADALCIEIMAFMQSCGGIYANYSRNLEEKVINSLASGQYILYRDDAGQIVHYLCYWNVHSNEIQDVIDGVTPVDIYRGSVLFVAEHGNKAGMQSMRKAVKELRSRVNTSGLFFRHKGGPIKIYIKQKGDGYGIRNHK